MKSSYSGSWQKNRTKLFEPVIQNWCESATWSRHQPHNGSHRCGSQFQDYYDGDVGSEDPLYYSSSCESATWSRHQPHNGSHRCGSQFQDYYDGDVGSEDPLYYSSSTHPSRRDKPLEGVLWDCLVVA